MKKQIMMLLSALLVVFSVFPALQPQAAEVTKQEVEVAFDVLKADSDDKSTAGDFMESPAKIVIEEGKTYAYVTLLQAKFWQSLKVQTTQPGTFTEDNFVDAVVVSEDAKADTRLVKFEIQDATKIVNVKAHIIVTGIPGIGEYDHSYDLRLKFDGSQVPATPEVKPEVTPEVKPEVKPEVTPEATTDGAFTIDFKALHEEEDKESSMTRYIETPAALTVKDGKNLVALTLTNNEQITAFEVEQDGKYVDATVVNTDEVANTRVVEFEVADLSAIINAKVTVFVAAANHTGNYTVRLAFDKESIKAVTTEEVEEVPEVPEVEVTVTFTDIDKSWAKSYIEALATKQIVKGKTATTFAPNDQLTNAQFATMLSRALDLPAQDFEGEFKPNDNITRQQMVTMIIRAIEYKDATVLEGVTNSITFADMADANADVKKSIDLAAGLGLISGKEVNGQQVFDPQANATRAQAAKVVYYLLEKVQ